MSIRILHCSTSVENYNICIEQQVAGFSHRGPQLDDLIYLVVKVGKRTLCGARFKLNAQTDTRPWPDGDRYKHALSLKELEYCQPFDISLLSQVGGKSWSIKYIQGSKPITDQLAGELLDKEFINNKIDKFIPFEVDTPIVSDSIAKELVSVPNKPFTVELPSVRDSFKIQAKLAEIGRRMNYEIWIPRNDRTRVLGIWQSESASVLRELPLNYDSDTLKTIENIDILWIKGHSIVRAFEVEHTTSIYSGILRMADLMTLQPNLRIKAHLIAPVEREEKVMRELSRPVFRHTLAQSCSFISYDSILELSKEKRLEFMNDAVLDSVSKIA